MQHGVLSISRKQGNVITPKIFRRSRHIKRLNFKRTEGILHLQQTGGEKLKRILRGLLIF